MFYAQTTRYVSTIGEDSNNGTETSPFKTIRKAVRSSFEGDIVKIDSGIYTGSVTFNISNLTITAWHPEHKPVIDASGPAFDTVIAVIKWTSNGAANYYNNNVLDGIIIKDANSPSLLGISINGNNNVIRNCELYNLGRTGILVQGDNNVVEYNIIDGITGITDKNIAGNNISIESYYSNYDSVEVRRNSENNIIRHNLIRNNPTHYGINIFPNTQDNTQPFMSGNKIYNNYIDKTGGGIYTRYQRNLEIFNNFILHSYHDPNWETVGGGITFDLITPNPHPLPVDGGTIKIYNNTIADNQYYGIENASSNTLEIYNNIFLNNYFAPNLSGGHILINLDPLQVSTATKIDNNLYFGEGCWRWGGVTFCNLISWQNTTNRDSASLIADPYFYDSASGDYRIRYNSPAKNMGKDLYTSGVVNDYFNNPRPYWNKNFDIGAYEISDAQLKLGVTGVDANKEVKHSIKRIGSAWERDNSGTFVLSTADVIDSSALITLGSSDQAAMENWHGWTYKWMNTSQSDSNLSYSLGFYKITNSLTNNYFFIDARDAVTSYSPDFFIILKLDSLSSEYVYYDNINGYRKINDGEILRLWEIKKENPNTAVLNNYLRNSLIWVDSLNHPNLIWGPYPDQSITKYRLYKRTSSSESFSYKEYPNNTFNIIDDFPLTAVASGVYPEYYVAAVNSDGAESNASNTIKITLKDMTSVGNNKYHEPEYSLWQNYPNPFNPNTTIKYSIAKDGNVLITLYDILGRLVKTFVNETKPAGTYEINFKGTDLSSGVYFYKIQSDNYSEVKKLQLLK